MDRILSRAPNAMWRMPCVLVLTDILVLCIVWPSSVYLRYYLGGSFNPGDYLELMPMMFVHVLINAFNGCYTILISPPDELKRCTKGTLLFSLIFTASTFWLRASYSYSRGILLLGGFFLLFLIPAARLVVKAWCTRYDWWGYQSVFYVCKDNDSQVLQTVLRRLNASLRPVLVLLPEGMSCSRQDGVDFGVPVLSGPEALSAQCVRQPHAVFVFLGLTGQGNESADIIEKAQRIFGRTIILHASLNFGNLYARTVDVGNLIGLEVMQRLLDSKRMLVKTVTDMIFSLLFLVLMVPCFGLIAACIWLESPGPILFRHTRLGRNGKPFQALKFRTMYPNSEWMLREALAQNEALQQHWEDRQKLVQDPRVTMVGQFLRRASLDELPQLINVLRGEMSLIGPRPIVAEEVQKYGEYFAFVSKVRPGLTGLWQVSGRNTLPYPERVALDVYYIRNWSLWLDMYVLLRTPTAVLNFSTTS